YDAIAFDRPGHGLSERPNGTSVTAEAQARLLHAALIELGIARPIIVAHSWSGALALALALEPEANLPALVLLAPAVYPDQEMFLLPRALVERLVLSELAIKLYSPFINRLFRRTLRQAFAPDLVPADYLQLAETIWLRPS